MSQDPAFPLRLRALEIKSFEHEGESWLHFHDPSGLSPDAQISQRLAPILALLDGSYDEKSLAAELDDQLGEPVDRAWLARLVAELDELLLIDSPTFREREAAAAAQFEAHSVRPPAFAGRSYAAQPELLNPYLRNLVQRGEALLTAPSDRKYRPEEVRGVVVPHIDFNRGGPEEALAFLPLVDNVAQTGRPYDTLVVLGIAHAGVRYPFCATTKDYETPLGTAACDREFLQDLQDKLGPQLIAEQIKHANEHSVEFVAVFAQYFPQLQRSQLVPIICGGFWEPMREGYSPCEDTQIGPFITALREVTAQHEAKGKKIGFIASVDGGPCGLQFRRRHPARRVATERNPAGRPRLVRSH